MKKAILALEDGSIFHGTGFGAPASACGEVCFNTSMTGYQEILTDPSYKGQIVTMTYPHIGNYGINATDRESPKPQVEGFVVREMNRVPSNYRSTTSLDAYLAEHRVVGIEGIDTRALVRKLRVRGAMTAVLSTTDLDDLSLLKKARTAPNIVGRDLVKSVMPGAAFAWSEGFLTPLATQELSPGKKRHRIVAMDFGMKWNILRCLVQIGCEVTVVPGSASAQQILELNPDGVFLSNAPAIPNRCPTPSTRSAP